MRGPSAVLHEVETGLSGSRRTRPNSQRAPSAARSRGRPPVPVARPAPGAVDSPSTRMNIAGAFAAGDVVDHTYSQAITAAGTGAAASLDAERYIAALADRAGARSAASPTETLTQPPHEAREQSQLADGQTVPSWSPNGRPARPVPS